MTVVQCKGACRFTMLAMLLSLAAFSASAADAQSATTATAPYDHMHFRVPDPAKAAEWYIKYMGGEKGSNANEVKFGSVAFMFLRAQEPVQPSAGSVIDHIGFSFKDLDAKMKELEAAGTKVITPTRDVANLFKLAFVEDPWGVKIELVQDDETPGFHHIHLRSTDAPAVTQWLKDTFGGEPAKLKGRIDGLKYGPLWVLVQPSKEEVAGSMGRAIDHLSWGTKDLDKTIAELKAKNVKFTSETRTFGAFKFTFVEGPSGLRVELLQRGN